MTLSTRLAAQALPALKAASHVRHARHHETLAGYAIRDDEPTDLVGDMARARDEWAWSLVWLLEWIRRGR